MYFSVNLHVRLCLLLVYLCLCLCLCLCVFEGLCNCCNCGLVCLGIWACGRVCFFAFCFSACFFVCLFACLLFACLPVVVVFYFSPFQLFLLCLTDEIDRLLDSEGYHARNSSRPKEVLQLLEVLVDLLKENTVSAATVLLYCAQLIVSKLQQTKHYLSQSTKMFGDVSVKESANADVHSRVSLAVGFTPRPFRCVINWVA